jgi:hypothetical protein
MRVEIRKGLVLSLQVVEALNQHQMLEHIGNVACVKGVAVAEHGVG